MGRTKVNIEDVYWGGNDNPTPFVTSIPIPVNGDNKGNLNEVLQVGSYSINVHCYNVPNEGCGNNTSSSTTAVPVSGALNVFMSGDTLFQQLFWEYSSGTILNQYQRVRTLSGSIYVWSDWKKLIKCDDYATDTEVGGIKIGFTPDASSPGNLPVLLGDNDNLNKAYVAMTSSSIKETLGINNSELNNGDDIFTSGLPTPANDFDVILEIGSYRVDGNYDNAPDPVCGTSTATTASMVGTLNVFRSGANDWELIQQLFWVLNGVTEQYQRSYYNNGSTMAWTDWKRLMKCDDYATDTEIGGIKIGYTPDPGSPGNLPVRLGSNDNLNKAFVVMTSRNIKQTLGVNNSNVHNGDDIFISGMPTPLGPSGPPGNFNEIFLIGSYRVYGSYDNAPNPVCGTSTATTASMVGALNVFRSGVNDWELIQQLFWVRSGVVQQYQRSNYNNGDHTTWTVWKRLIKCDDYADMDGNGGIISSANLQELFRSPDIIQLFNENGMSLAGGDYYLDTFLPIIVTIQNIIQFDGGINIINLNAERVYRVTYDVNCIRVEGKGDVTIRIEDGNGELYSTTEYISDLDVRKRIAFSIMLTNLDCKIMPTINIESELVILINPYCYQVSVEEIRFPYFNPVPLTH